MLILWGIKLNCFVFCIVKFGIIFDTREQPTTIDNIVHVRDSCIAV